MRSRSEERRVGKSVDHCVTGVQTCALPILQSYEPINTRSPATTGDDLISLAVLKVHSFFPSNAFKIGRASCREECRSLCDWSSDVCSSDLAVIRADQYSIAGHHRR